MMARALVLVLGLGIADAACGQYSISNIRALKAFKEANELYGKREFKGASDAYQRVFEYNPDFIGIAYFFLGNSYDSLYKPGKKGEPENDAYLRKAVENYKLAIEKIKDTDTADAPVIRKRAYEFLIVAYNDKLNDLASAEPLAKRMIEMDPNEPANYILLGRLYEDSGRLDDAEAQLKKGIQIRPKDAVGYQALAMFYNRQGQFEKTMGAWVDRANAEPNNPEAWHTIAGWYFDETHNDKRLAPAKQKEYIMKGLDAEDKALALSAEYYEALAFKGILLHMQANLEPAKDQALIKRLMAEADQYHDRAMAAKKKQEEGAKAAATAPVKKGGGV
jgi:tetratricopeptide (TPR) repeat protein